ncbi:MAG: tRNA 2-thiouridine(34) synthase MnmA [Lachnospiraceae bacterium]|nr:tRNA 2-thiouridine(34) synthase MnmA [Lachnospiraceae bacterium]
MSMPRVLVGLSGGVDSAVAALLLKKDGYDVVGVTLRTWLSESGEESRCCEIDDARFIAMKLNIPYYPLNCADAFKKCVIDPFVESYLKGETPNPCIECNRYIKWERMLYYSNILKCDYVATGHYASVVRFDNGRYSVKQALHAKKDQTYMLYKLTQEQLKKTLMPLGEMTKERVREIAKEEGLPVANKPDSQEICFISDDDYAGYIEKHCFERIPEEGNFVDDKGNILGKHKGIIHYTVGQRKGLKISAQNPLYVKYIDPVENEIVLGEENEILYNKIECSDMNFLSIERPSAGYEFECKVKVRYHHIPQEAKVKITDLNNAAINFYEPVKAPAPGQSAVFYDSDDCVIGGGIIQRSDRT